MCVDVSKDEADRMFVAKDRVFERTQGCWSCKHGSREEAKRFWTAKRQEDLMRALSLTNDSPHGEEDIRVKNIRHMVDTIDHSVAAGALIRCSGSGKTAAGEPVGDLIAHNYLCSNWSGKQGASIARAGQKLDELPEEIQDRIDNVGGLTGVPESVRSLFGNKKVD